MSLRSEPSSKLSSYLRPRSRQIQLYRYNQYQYHPNPTDSSVAPAATAAYLPTPSERPPRLNSLSDRDVAPATKPLSSLRLRLRLQSRSAAMPMPTIPAASGTTPVVNSGCEAALLPTSAAVP